MNLMEMLKGYFDEAKIKELSDKLGESTESVKAAVDKALPTLMATMSQKIEEGKMAVLGFLDKDKDGNILDDLKGMFGFGEDKTPPAPEATTETTASEAVFEDQHENVTAMISQESGMSEEKTKNLLDEITSQVFAFLGQKKGENFDAASLLESVKKEGFAMKDQIEGHLKGFMKQLDKDGDGNIVEDLTDMGKNLFGGLFGGKKEEKE